MFAFHNRFTENENLVEKKIKNSFYAHSIVLNSAVARRTAEK